MESKLTLSHQSWMDDAALQRVMNALDADGGNALIVGGAVRSAILNEALGDIDIATKFVPADVTKRLENAGLKVVPTGIDHGTVTAVVDHRGFEITTLRRDVETDGRRAVVAFSTDWREDSERRDFTMNTLLMNMRAQVFDPTGTGVTDLKSGVVRFVGDADVRIAEDALRILRFFRFHARYGKGRPDGVGLAACKKRADLVSNLSRERVTTEVEKLLAAPGAAQAISDMCGAGVLPDLIGKAFNEESYELIRQLVLKPESEVPHAILLMYCLSTNESNTLDEVIVRYFVLSNKKRDYLRDCMKYLLNHTDSVQKNLFIFGLDITLSGEVLFNVLNGKSKTLKALEALVENIKNTPIPHFPLEAGHVMDELKLKPGKQLGDVLKSTQVWWLDQDTKPSYQQCLNFAKTLL